MSEQRVGILIEATDKASAALNKIGDVAKRNFDGIGKTVASLPDKLGKASTAMLLLQNSTSQMGGKVADAVNKVTALAGVMATGGPLGIAIGAVTVATMGITKLYEKWGEESRKLAEKQKEAAEYIKKIKDETLAQADGVRTLREEVENFGKTAREVRINQARIELELAEKQYDRYNKFIDQVYAAQRAGRELSEEQAVGLEKREAEKAAILDRIGALSEEVKLLEDLTKKEEAEAEAKSKEANATRDAAQAERELAAAIREGRAALIERQEEIADEEADVRGRQIDAMEEQAARERELRGLRIEEMKAAQEEENAILQEHVDAFLQGERDKQAASKQTEQQIKAFAASIADAWAQAAVASATGSKTSGQAAKEAAISTAQIAINSALASASAKAMEAYSFLPFIGIALGLGAVGALSGIILSFLSDVPKAARGLRIPGGGKGGESIVHTMRTDETVLDPASSKIWAQLTAALEGGASIGSGGGSSIVVHYSPRMAVADNSAGHKRTIRDLNKALKLAKR